MYTLEELKSIVEKYVRDILQQHDLSVARNSTNKKIFNNIVDKCMDDLKNTELRDQFDNDNQGQLLGYRITEHAEMYGSVICST